MVATVRGREEAVKLLRLRDKKQRVMHYPITFIDVAISPNKSGLMIKQNADENELSLLYPFCNVKQLTNNLRIECFPLCSMWKFIACNYNCIKIICGMYLLLFRVENI